MIAAELISDLVSPLRTSDTGEDALTVMHVYHVKHLPIVNDTILLGTISEEDILTSDLDEPIGSYRLGLEKAYVKKNDHLFEVMARMAKGKLTAVPVVDDDEDYMGVITQERLIHYYANSFAFKEPGSILVLELNEREYSLAEISRIVEGEGVAILSCFVTSEPDTRKVFVTLKLNTRNDQRIIASLERHEFKVKAFYSEDKYYEDLKERYDALMSYLNV